MPNMNSNYMIGKGSEMDFNANGCPNSVIISVYNLLEKRTIYSSSTLSLYQVTGYDNDSALDVLDVFLLNVVHPQDKSKLLDYLERKSCIITEFFFFSLAA